MAIFHCHSNVSPKPNWWTHVIWKVGKSRRLPNRLVISQTFLHNSKSWWRHQMETFSALMALCAGNSPVPVNSPHKGQWRGALMFSLICAQINDWVNNREAGNLRRHRGHCDVTVMVQDLLVISSHRAKRLFITIWNWVFLRSQSQSHFSFTFRKSCYSRTDVKIMLLVCQYLLYL